MNPSDLPEQQQEVEEQNFQNFQTNDMDWIIKPQQRPNSDTPIGGLAISGIDFCQSREKMQREQIKAVVSVCGDKLTVPVKVEHLWIVVEDHPKQDISIFFNSTFDFIQRHIKNGNVLVHCRAGISRSSSIVIAYLIKKNRLDFQQALTVVRMSRPIILPNKGFTKQLKRLANQVNSNSQSERSGTTRKNSALNNNKGVPKGCIATKDQKCVIF